MRAAPRDFVVTGMGAVCAVAQNLVELSEAVQDGRGGIGPIGRFPTDGFLVHTGAEVPRGPLDASDDVPAWELCLRFAARAAAEAGAQAAITTVAADRIGLVFGTGLGDLERAVHELAEAVAREVGVQGPVLSVSTACSSSTGAIGLARDLLASGSADLVLAGGADVLTPEVFAGFHALGVLTPEKCAPFSAPFGTTLGEGAGFLALEARGSAASRGVAAHATLSGYGLSADGHHETSPEPKGSGVTRAIDSALTDAGIVPSEIGYVNAHGSGTEANDPSEWRGIDRALGAGSRVPVSSTKGALGHTQGAAGVLETVVTILTMGRGQVAPTLNFTGRRRFAPPDPVPGPYPRSARYDHALCLNSAFGGSNAALVISRAGTQRARARSAVEVLGLGLVSPWGLGIETLLEGARAPRGPVPHFDLADVDRRLDPRGLDPTSRFLTAAARLALADAGIAVRGRLRERTGLITGAVRPSPASLRAFRESIDERGLPDLSTAAFARIVLNAPSGACSKLLSLRGPHTVLSVGDGSGLAAVACAAELASTREDVELMLAAGVHEMEPASGPRPTPAAEGAACVVLGRAGAVPARADTPDRPRVRVAGWGLAGPGRLADATERARALADPDDVRDGTVTAFFDEAAFSCGGPSAFPSALAFVAAAAEILRGNAERAWVTSDRGYSTSVALLLTA